LSFMYFSMFYSNNLYTYFFVYIYIYIHIYLYVYSHINTMLFRRFSNTALHNVHVAFPRADGLVVIQIVTSICSFCLCVQSYWHLGDHAWL
jgi:hypothetical protein